MHSTKLCTLKASPKSFRQYHHSQRHVGLAGLRLVSQNIGASTRTAQLLRAISSFGAPDEKPITPTFVWKQFFMESSFLLVIKLHMAWPEAVGFLPVMNQQNV
jgi:hypothetical protein